MESPDRSIPEGRRYHTLCDLEMQVHEYDRLGVQTEMLPAGSVFQPWDPQPHWNGEKVAITLGGEHSEFDWGVISGEGHFLAWEDFWSRCVPEELYSAPDAERTPHRTLLQVRGIMQAL